MCGKPKRAHASSIFTEGMRLVDVGIPPISVRRTRVQPAHSWADIHLSATTIPTRGRRTTRIQKLTFSVPPNSRFDPAHPPPPRVFNGYLATPKGPVPPGGFRAVVAVNGHDGSAQQVMTSSDPYFWYGESAARRDLIVLAIDIGHRPNWQTGPIVHPPIIDAGYADSNWRRTASAPSVSAGQSTGC